MKQSIPLRPAEIELVVVAEHLHKSARQEIDQTLQRRYAAVALSHGVVEGQVWELRKANNGEWFIDLDRTDDSAGSGDGVVDGRALAKIIDDATGTPGSS